MSLIHIHALTCRYTNQYWSCDHPKQTLPQFLSTLVNLETTTLSPTHGYKLIMFFDIHDSVNHKKMLML